MTEPMTPEEVIDLLTLVAGYDQRTVGHDDVRAWLLVAQLEQWTLPLASRAVVEHYRADAARGRITPAHISDQIRAVRARVKAAALHRDLVPPRELADDPAAEVRWRRDTAAALVARGLADWAATGVLPPPGQQPEAAPVRTIPERIRALIGSRFTAPDRDQHRGAPDPAERAARRDAARRELAARGPGKLPEEG